MRLARTGAADQHHVCRRLGKIERCELPDQRLIDLARLEIETGEIAMHRKTRRAVGGFTRLTWAG